MKHRIPPHDSHRASLNAGINVLASSHACSSKKLSHSVSLIVGVVFSTSLLPVLAKTVRGAEKKTSDFAAVRDGVLAMMHENCSRLKRCNIIWTHRIVENEFVPGRSGNLESTYELWIDREKVAVKSHEQTWEKGDDADWDTSSAAYWSAFNGRDFRRREEAEATRPVIQVQNDPKFLPYQDWLDVIQWDKGGDLEALRAGIFDQCRLEWSIRSQGTDRILQVTITNSKAGTGRENAYDLQKGGQCFKRTEFDAQGRVHTIQESALREVQPDVWMPVRVIGGVLDPETGHKKLWHEYAIDLEKSRFGDDAVISTEVFDIPITPDVVVIDTRAGSWAEYTGRSSLMPLDELRSAVARRLAKKARSEEHGSPVGPEALHTSGARHLRWVLMGLSLVLIVLGLVVFLRIKLRPG